MQAVPHPYLKVGKRVRITTGPLEGLEGIVVREKNALRFVISLDLISVPWPWRLTSRPHTLAHRSEMKGNLVEEIKEDAGDSKAALEQVVGGFKLTKGPRVYPQLKRLSNLSSLRWCHEQGRSRERYRRAALTTVTFVVAGAGLVLGTRFLSWPARAGVYQLS